MDLFAHVACRIGTEKCKNTSDNSNEPRKSIRGPFSAVDECHKNILCRPVRSEIDQRDQDGKESQNVEDQDKSFDFRQPSGQESVDEDNDENECVKYKSPLPSCWHIAIMIQDNHSLDD